MRMLPMRLTMILSRRGMNLTRMAKKHRTQKSVLSEILTEKRNTARLVKAIETETGLSISEIRSIYRQDKNRKPTKAEIEQWKTKLNGDPKWKKKL